MLQANSIFGFLARFLIVYLVLTFLWMGIGGAYGNFYRSLGQGWFGEFYSGAPHGNVQTQFTELSESERERESYDTRIMISSQYAIDKAKREAAVGATQAQAKALQAPVSSWVGGYLATILLISLILASPVGIKQRLMGLGIGLIMVHGVIWLKLRLHILKYFYDAPFLGGEISGSSKDFLDGIQGILSFNNMESNVIFPVAIWILVTFRRSDWQNLIQSVQPKEAESEK